MPQILIIAAGTTCDGRPNELEDGARSVAQSLTDALLERGAPNPITLSGPRVCEVEAHVKALEARPLMLFYVGHGRLQADCDGDGLDDCKETEQWCCDGRCRDSQVVAPRQSNLCLADGSLPVDRVLEWIPENVPEALVIVDACCSADVDVRKSRVPTSVMSATPFRVLTERGRPLLTSRVVAALRDRSEGDEKSEFEVVTDEELLDFASRVARLDDSHSVLPKLRKNTARRFVLPGATKTVPSLRDAAPLWWIEDPEDPLFEDPEFRAQALALERGPVLEMASKNPHLAIYEVVHDEIGHTLTVWRLPERILVGEAAVTPGRRPTASMLRRIQSTPMVEYEYGGCVIRFPESIDSESRDDPHLVSRPCADARGQCFVPVGEDRCRCSRC